MTSRKALKDVGHGMSYTLLADAMICTMEMPTWFSCRTHTGTAAPQVMDDGCQGAERFHVDLGHSVCPLCLPLLSVHCAGNSLCVSKLCKHPTACHSATSHDNTTHETLLAAWWRRIGNTAQQRVPPKPAHGSAPYYRRCRYMEPTYFHHPPRHHGPQGNQATDDDHK